MFHHLGKLHADISWSTDSILKKPLTADMKKRLRKVFRYLQTIPEIDESHSLQVEWFLDNYHVLLDAMAISHECLVADLYERLPCTSDAALKGIPRILLLACEVINANELRIDEQILRNALSAYQKYASLTVAEIWALPIMLRLVLLSLSLSSMEKFLPEKPPEPEFLKACKKINVKQEALVSRAIHTLRVLNTIDWMIFFDAVSELEAELAGDPARVYAEMDFRTRDRYRKVVEEIAWQLRRSELDIARETIDRARHAPTFDVRRRHIGYYLIDRGRHEFERALGYRPQRPERIRRFIRRHATCLYLSCIGISVALFMITPLWLLAHDNPSTEIWLILGFLALIPAWNLGIELVQWAVTHIFPPELLPRMDFSKGIMPGARTIVVVPAMLANAKTIRQLNQDLEIRYLSNSDPNLSFVLLTDFLDGREKEIEGDQHLLARAEEGIKNLNIRYADSGRDKFYLMHRERLWSEGERIWKGWERKRGKIVEFNRWLLGDEGTSFKWHFGRTQLLRGTRFVITLDADTKMPKGAARTLASIMAHPLNKAEFDPKTKRVIAGYTVVQPRVEIDPASEESSTFTRIIAGDIGIDPYSHAVSDAYQDLFGTGIYVGKGIYDVKTFTSSLAHTIPPHRVLSHDLLEGVLGRAGLASDVCVYEHYPPNYVSYTRRMHRWIRGDWQLIPWLLPFVPTDQGKRERNPLALIDRWKILDNMRRSLFFPFLFAFLVAGWLIAPSALLAWTLIGILAPAAFFLISLATRIIGGFRRPKPGGFWTTLHGIKKIEIERWMLPIIFTCHLAIATMDAVVRALVRMFITHHHLLEWVTFSAANARSQKDSIRKTVWMEMWSSTLLALATLSAIVVLRPEALPYSMPLLFAWIAAPEIARWLSMPPRDIAPETLGSHERETLRELAFRTWHYFETFVEPISHWLPPDNFQESPRGEVAQRTSPTNIAMMFLVTLVARDLGFIGIANFVRRLRFSLDTLARMPRYRGHILNWVDTSTLEPLEPRYVSTVDSGNFAGALITVRQACMSIESQEYLRDAQWHGLCDILGLLEQAVSSLLRHSKLDSYGSIETIDAIRSLIRHREPSNLGHVSLIAQLRNDNCKQLDETLLDLLHHVRENVSLTDLEEIETWSDDLSEHLESMHLEVETCFPWLNLLLTPPDTETQDKRSILEPAWQELRRIAQLATPLSAVAESTAQMQSVLRAWRESRSGDLPPTVETWLQTFEEALVSGTEASTSIRRDLHGIADLCLREIEQMDFSLLFDKTRNLFHIGFNVSQNRLDPHHYDMIASEARLTSFIGIARGVAPLSHWMKMSRPTVRERGKMVLLAWSGTMFEYLMPTLLMHSNQTTLLSRGCAEAVHQQMIYARNHGVPWGISESGYYRFDPNLKYQYKAFGVPALGLKRGLGEDLVIAPYASLLAISLKPKAVMENFRKLKDKGAVGRFGLFEALDFTATRMRDGRRFQIVRSYMAHHQGMILCAIGNYLHADMLKKYFHADPMVRSAESLLNERIPSAITLKDVHRGPDIPPKPLHKPPPQLRSWIPPDGAPVPQINILSNGRLSTRLTDYGAGDLSWSGLSLTRWRPDTTRDHWGYWIYIRDEDSHLTWPNGFAPAKDGREETQVIFFPHKAELSRRRDGLFIRTEICVTAYDDVDVRRLEIQNESGRERHITVTSYAEIVMADYRSDEMHPAFEKLFTESSYDADFDMLEFHRRPRYPEQKPVVLAHCGFGERAAVTRKSYETDRCRFLGRGRDASRPVAVNGSQLSGTVGNTLDPVMSVQVPITLRPYETAIVNFVTAVASSKERVRKSLARYRNDASCRLAMQEAMIERRRELAAIGIDPSNMGDIQRLFSALQYPDSRLGSTHFHQGRIRLEQPAMWPFGISGDFPILLIKLYDSSEMGLLETLLNAHHYWRNGGQSVDLVLLNQEASTYDNKASERIQSTIVQCHGMDWQSRHGGIFVINRDQLSDLEAERLEAGATVVLNSHHGTLEQQLQKQDQPVQYLPILVPTLTSVEEPVRSLRIDGLRYQNEYGGFSQDGREYITFVENDRRPPAPWSNVLANDRFGCVTTESGGGYSWFMNSGEYRLTPWSNDPVTDQAGEVLYLRDEQSVQIWSPLPLPGQMGSYRIHHGAGYTSYVHHSHQLEQEVRVFVPPADTVKIVHLRLKNRANYRRRVTATYYAEWVLGSQRSKTQTHIMTRHIPWLQGIFADCSWNPDFGSCVAFLGSSHVTHGFTCDRKEFLGRYGSTPNPAALQRVGLSGRSGPGIDPCAALQIHLELDPQEEITCHFILGAATERKTAKRLCRKYSRTGAADSAWERMCKYWDRLLGTITVNTPEPAMDLLLNRWLLYQAVSSRIFARTGFYQSSGAYGFRDQLQDVMALMMVKPEMARAQILESAERQFESGDVLHWWHPPSGKGVRTRCSDDLLWLPYVTGEYVKTTGDTQILNETIPFLSATPLEAGEDDRYGEFEAGNESSTLLEHCRRALLKGFTTGPQGLPLIGSGDWNDAMNRVGIEGRGESVWLAWFACSAAQRYVELCQFAGETEVDSSIEKWVGAVQKAVQDKAWDGAWYRRAFYDDGTPIGTATGTECRIDSISQSWATLSGSPATERAKQGLESALEFLVHDEERIISLLTPPFDAGVHDPGYIRGYPPGVRENGGQYTHAAAWLAWALAQQGDGDRAEYLFRLLNPVMRSTDKVAVDRYRVEPYVLAADIYSSEQHLGRGGWTWYTGSASWLWRLGIEAILGLRRMGAELVFDPCIPKTWPGFSIDINLDEAPIKVEVRNPLGICHGVCAVETGGHMIASNRLAVDAVQGRHVIVHMGEQDTLETKG